MGSSAWAGSGSEQHVVQRLRAAGASVTVSQFNSSFPALLFARATVTQPRSSKPTETAPFPCNICPYMAGQILTTSPSVFVYFLYSRPRYIRCRNMATKTEVERSCQSRRLSHSIRCRQESGGGSQCPLLWGRCPGGSLSPEQWHHTNGRWCGHLQRRHLSVLGAAAACSALPRPRSEDKTTLKG